MVVLGTSLEVQWLRLHLQVQGTWVQFLVKKTKNMKQKQY